MRTTELLAKMRLDASQFDKSLKQSSAELQSFARVNNALPAGRNNPLSALAADASALVPALSSAPLAIAAVSASLVAAGAAARSAGVEFEASLTKIATLGADAQQNLGATRQAILDTFASTAVTGGVTDLAEANYLLQSSGRSATEAIEDLDVAARASVAGYTAVTSAVDGLTTVTAAWKDQQISTTRASDVLFQSVNVGKATYEEIASQIGLVAPLAASAGVRFEEVAAATALLSNQGLRTSSIMEGLRSAILNIQRPTEDFKKKYADLAREFSASRLARDGIVQFLRDFNTASGGSRAALTALFSDATGLTAALGLLRNGGEDAAAALQQMDNAAGATDRALSKVNESTKAQEQLLKNQISSAWTQFGELLVSKTLPILEKVSRVINDITEGAAFAQRDTAKLLQLTGAETRVGAKVGDTRAFEQENALRSLIDQFTDSREKFLKSLSRDELEKLGPELIRLRASGVYQQNSRTAITADLVNAVVDERLKRDSQAAGDAQRGFAGQEATRTAAGERAKDEAAQRAREKATTDAERAKAEADRRTKELARERQRVVEEATKLTQDLEAQAVEALHGTAGALQRVMEQTLSEGAKLLASGVLSPEASAALTAQLAQFEDLKTQMISAERAADDTKAALDAALSQEELPALKTLAAREREVQAILDGTNVLEERKKIEEQLAALAKARGDITGNTFGLPSPDRIDTQIQLIGDLAQSIATLGDQMGILPQRAVDAVRGIGALVEQGSQFSKLFGAGSTATTAAKFAGGIGIAAGVASLAAGLFTESPEDKQRRAELRANTEALRGLTLRAGSLAGASVSGDVIARVTAASSRVLARRSTTNAVFLSDAEVAPFIAREAGVTLEELKSLLSTLGITLNASRESVQQLRDGIQASGFKVYSETFAGSMERLADTLRADGVTDAIEVFRRRIAALTDAKTGFPALADALSGIDLSTEAGRATASDRARALFDELIAGRINPAQFGGLTFADARAAILDVITVARDIGGSSGTGGFNENRQITEVTGSRLAGLLGTANTFLRQIADDIAALRATIVVGPPTLLRVPSLGGLAGAAGGPMVVINGGITIQLTLTRDLLGADAATALALGDTLSRTIGAGLVGEIDAQLRDRELRQRLLLGNPVLSS